jgi:hypothetical protein
MISRVLFPNCRGGVIGLAIAGNPENDGHLSPWQEAVGHEIIPDTHKTIRVRSAIVQVAALSMLDVGQQAWLCRAIASQFVGDNHPPRVLQALQQTLEEPLGSISIMLLLDQNPAAAAGLPWQGQCGRGSLCSHKGEGRTCKRTKCLYLTPVHALRRGNRNPAL